MRGIILFLIVCFFPVINSSAKDTPSIERQMSGLLAFSQNHYIGGFEAGLHYRNGLRDWSIAYTRYPDFQLFMQEGVPPTAGFSVAQGLALRMSKAVPDDAGKLSGVIIRFPFSLVYAHNRDATNYLNASHEHYDILYHQETGNDVYFLLISEDNINYPIDYARMHYMKLTTGIGFQFPSFYGIETQFFWNAGIEHTRVNHQFDIGYASESFKLDKYNDTYHLTGLGWDYRLTITYPIKKW